MTTPESTAAVVVEARDRATATMNKITAGLNRMQSQAASTGVSMARLSGQGGALASGLAQVGTAFGPASLAFTGLGIGIGFATNKITELIKESREASKAARDLENNLILTGFSAISADSAVGEMRNQMNRTAFQTLPKLSLEMQRLFGTMDQDSRKQVEAMTEVLTDLGRNPVDSVDAVLNAFQGNFGPISQLIGEPINNLDEFNRAMERLAVQGTISGNEFLTEFGRVIDGYQRGALTAEEAGRQLTEALKFNFGEAGTASKENIDTIVALLQDLSAEELLALARNTDSLQGMGWNMQGLGVTYAEIFTRLATSLSDQETREADHTGVLQEEIARRIEEIRKVDPALADTVGAMLKQYKNDENGLKALDIVTAGIVGELKGEYSTLAEGVETEIGRIAEDYQGTEEDLGNLKKETLSILREIGKEHHLSAGDIERAMDRAVAAYQRAEAALRSYQAAQRSAASAGSSVSTRVPTATPQPVRRLPSIRSIGASGPGPRGFHTGGIVRTPTEAIVGEIPELIAPLDRLPDLIDRSGIGTNRPIHITIQVGDQVLKDFIIQTLDEEISIREPNLGLG